MQDIRLSRRGSLRRVALLSTVALAACGVAFSSGAGATTRPTSTSTAAGNASHTIVSNPKIALVSTESLKTTSLGKSVVPGLNKIEATYHTKVSISDGLSPAQISPALQDYANRGYNLVIANGASLQQPVLDIAKQFPKTDFVVINGNKAQRPNVAAVDFVWEQAGFMAGLVAGVATKTETVAGVGSIHIPPIQRLLDGFKQGVKATNRRAKVLDGYSGSFTDPAVNKTLTLSLIAQNADVVFTVATGGDPGVFQATDQKGVLAVGYAVNEAPLGPKSVATSVLVKYGKTVFDAAKLWAKGTLKPKVYDYGLKQGVFGMAPYKHLPANERRKIAKLVHKTLKGGFKIKIG